MDHACDYRTFQPQQPIRFLCALLPYWQPLVSWTTATPDKSKLIPAITILQPLSKNGKELTAAFWLTANQCLYWGARLYKSGNVVDMITSYFLLWFSLPTARPPWFGHMSMFIGVCFFLFSLRESPDCSSSIEITLFVPKCFNAGVTRSQVHSTMAVIPDAGLSYYILASLATIAHWPGTHYCRRNVQDTKWLELSATTCGKGLHSDSLCPYSSGNTEGEADKQHCLAEKKFCTIFDLTWVVLT